MDLPLDFLSRIDVTNLLAMAAMFWLFNGRLDRRFEAIDKRFDSMEKRFEGRFDSIDRRFDKVDEKITDIDRRLCRLEGAFASKDCCMIKDDRQLKKAE